MSVRVLSAAILTGAAAMLLAAPSALADDALAGRWTGMVEQPGSGSYPAVMQFDRAGRGSSDYPTLDCSGKLSGSGIKGNYRFRETIAGTGRAGEGSGRCIDGTINLSVSGDVMHWTWTGEWQGKPMTASGTFAREAGSN